MVNPQQNETITTKWETHNLPDVDHSLFHTPLNILREIWRSYCDRFHDSDVLSLPGYVIDPIEHKKKMIGIIHNPKGWQGLTFVSLQ